MDRLLTCILQIYRAAQTTLLDEFQQEMLGIVQQVLSFRSAAWCNDVRLGPGTEPFVIRSVEAFNEPDTIAVELPEVTGNYVAAIKPVANQPRIALPGFAPSICTSKRDAGLREYLRRYGHEHNLIIADIETPTSRGSWLSLYRPADWDAFNESDQRALTFLMPHLVEARAINYRLALGHSGFESRDGLSGTRALIQGNGTIIHAGFRFRELLDTHSPGVSRTRLPARLLSQLQRRGTAVLNGVRITASTLGSLQLLCMQQLSVSELSTRETDVLRLMSKGLSFEEVSTHLEISTHTTITHAKKIYRKLGVHSRSEAVYEAVQRGLL